MDPNETLRRIALAAQRDDADELHAAATDLQNWLNKGGFPPDLKGETIEKDRELALLILDGIHFRALYPDRML